MFTIAKEIQMTPEVLEAAKGDSLLEKLQAALVSLGKHPYHFEDWAQCTCGHIYRAAHGRGTANLDKVLKDRSLPFHDLLQVVVDANDLKCPGDDTNSLRHAVSDATYALVPKAPHLDGPKLDAAAKQAAITLIENAIAFEQKRNEQARLALIGS